jgi:hypothetical protein
LSGEGGAQVVDTLAICRDFGHAQSAAAGDEENPGIVLARRILDQGRPLGQRRGKRPGIDDAPLAADEFQLGV